VLGSENQNCLNILSHSKAVERRATELGTVTYQGRSWIHVVRITTLEPHSQKFLHVQYL